MHPLLTIFLVPGDVTCLATIPHATQAEAQFLAKADGVVAGQAVADAVFQQVDPDLQVRRISGWCDAGKLCLFSCAVFTTWKLGMRSLGEFLVLF
jgi:hypothetical protein